MTQPTETEDRGRMLRWDGTITAGILLTAGVLVVAVISWNLRLEGRVERQEERQATYERAAAQMRIEDQKREMDAFAEVRASLRRIEDHLLGGRGRAP